MTIDYKSVFAQYIRHINTARIHELSLYTCHYFKFYTATVHSDVIDVLEYTANPNTQNN